MAEPIIFTLLFGNKDQLLEKIRNQEAQSSPAIISLQTNKESHISDKDRIFAEILEESSKQNKTPIFNIQLNDNNSKPIFKLQDLINLQNLNIKTTITFDRYNPLAENPELAAYWQQLLTKATHIFFTNEQERELAIKESIVSREKTTAIKDTDIDSIISVFNNLADDKKVNQLLSDTIPDKTKLDKIITTAKNQGGRVIVKTWPLSADEATNLITAKFGITSEDQIYGLKLEITEILKDQTNAAKNLQKYVSQISQQFQKDLGKPEINPIDFNFDKEKIMKNTYNADDPEKQKTTPYEPLKENQPERSGFFRRIFNYFKDIITSFLGKKEETQLPQKPYQAESDITPPPTEKVQQQVTPSLPKIEQQLSTKLSTNNTSLSASSTIQHDPFRVRLGTNDINDVKKPDHWYENHQIQYILEESLNKNDFSVHAPISLNQNTNSDLLPPDQNPENVLKNAVSQVIDGNKKAAVIPIEMGYGHWTGLVVTYDEKDKQVILTFNDSLGNTINYDDQKLPKLLDKALSDLPNKPIIIDEQTKQQNNNLDCGVFAVDNLIRLANGKPVLTTEEAKNKGQELRNQHAEILTKVMAKEQAQEIGQRVQDIPPKNNQFQNLINSQNQKVNKDSGRKL